MRRKNEIRLDSEFSLSGTLKRFDFSQFQHAKSHHSALDSEEQYGVKGLHGVAGQISLEKTNNFAPSLETADPVNSELPPERTNMVGW